MKIRIKMPKVILMAAVLTLGISISTYAKETEDALMHQGNIEETDNVEEEQMAGEETAVTVQPRAGLSLAVDYPSVIKCKEEITFTMNASGGTGNYEYRLDRLFMEDPSGTVSMYDTSFGSKLQFKKENQFKTTFHVPGIYYIGFIARDADTNVSMVRPVIYTLNIQDDRYPSVEQIVNEVAAECEKTCLTDFEKALWLHDWLLEHSEYDYSLSFCAAEGVLARGKGTCESYHSAYQMLLNKVGIQTGRTISSSHVWTAVRMDGEWYQVDCTWDETGQEKHMYFGLTDELIGIAGPAHEIYKITPGCESTSLENNYFIKTGKITQWSDPLVPFI